MRGATTSDRLKQIMLERNMKQVDILNACKPYCEKYGVRLGKSDLSQYISGKVQPGQDKLSILGLALNVNEVWLMGYNVPAGRNKLNMIGQELEQDISNCGILEHCYGKAAVEAIQLFVRLDVMDQGQVIGSMKTLLQGEKYSQKEELLKRKII